MFERFGGYLKAAFTTRWNLLLFGGGVAAAFISGFPGVLLPLVLAGEVFYLANMLANDRFRAAVEAQDAKSRRSAEAANAREAYERIRKNLPPPLLRRFDQLRDHCLKLVALAGNMRGPDRSAPDTSALESLDRLLWGYLRMIWGAATLSDFLDHTDGAGIRDRITELEARLANLEEAKRKLDLVAAEIERLEAKIAALAEGSVAKRDVTDIAQRVDEVAEGMRKTDETMRQLQLPPELEDLEEPPQLLREEA